MATALEQKAIRSAQRAGLVARKWRGGNVLENKGGYIIFDPRTNLPVAGFEYNLTPDDVIEYCTAD
jgi:hypothetical protein